MYLLKSKLGPQLRIVNIYVLSSVLWYTNLYLLVIGIYIFYGISSIFKLTSAFKNLTLELKYGELECQSSLTCQCPLAKDYQEHTCSLVKLDLLNC